MTANDDGNITHELKATGIGAFIHIVEGRGVLRVDGSDTLDLLNRLSTNKVDDLRGGQVRETLFTTDKGRVLDAALVLPMQRGARLLLSPGMPEPMKTWLERYTIMDDCEYTDVTAMYTQISIYNPGAALIDVGMPEPGLIVMKEIAGATIELARVDSVCGSELRILCPPSHAQALLDFFARLDIPTIGAQAFDLWRVATLTPAVGHELSDRSNPLEAGARHAVDFNKGCYIGQEVISRLESYDKVQRRLARVHWPHGVPDTLAPGSMLLADGRDAGFITTHVFDPVHDEWIGIACIRNVFAETGTELNFHLDGMDYPILVD